MKRLLILIAFGLGCTSSTKEQIDTTLNIEISKEGQYIVEEVQVPEENLQDYLLNELKKIEQSGYKRSEIAADVRAHPEAKVGMVSYLQVALKNLGVRKVLYSNASTESDADERNL